MFSTIAYRFGIAVMLFALAVGATGAGAEDDVTAFRVYSWSSLEKPHRDTASDCRAIDKTKGERGWSAARREMADVSDLKLPNKQKEGSAFRVFVDYCVRVDGNRERPVGAMTFRAAPHDDLTNVKRWGSRHYKATARVRKKTPKPGREHFDRPNFERKR